MNSLFDSFSSDDNMYTLDYLCEMTKHHPKPEAPVEEMEVSRQEGEDQKDDEVPLAAPKTKGKKRKASKK